MLGKKGVAALIIGKPVKGNESEEIMEPEEHSKMAHEGAELAAKKLIEAVDKGDAAMVVKAFKMLTDMCTEMHETDEDDDSEEY